MAGTTTDVHLLAGSAACQRDGGGAMPPFVVSRGGDMSTPNRPRTRRSAFELGLAAACPHCGEGRLFQGYLTVAPRCQACGLEYDFADSADGPAVFVMMLIGFVVCAAALTLEVKLHPPLWLHLVLWIPIATGLALAALRPMKAIMIATQYKESAREGRLEGRG
jgi:uncharacterized protein (DUF983 family)